MLLGIQTGFGEEAKKDNAPPGYRPVATMDGSIIYRKPDGGYYNPLTGENLRVANRVEQGGVVREIVQGINGNLTYMFSTGSGNNVSINSVQLPKQGTPAERGGAGGSLDGKVQDALLKTGKELMEKRKYQDAIHYFEELTQRFPNNADHWERLGDAYFQNKHIVDAHQAYLSAFSLDPNGTRPGIWRNIVLIAKRIDHPVTAKRFNEMLEKFEGDKK